MNRAALCIAAAAMLAGCEEEEVALQRTDAQLTQRVRALELALSQLQQAEQAKLEAIAGELGAAEARLDKQVQWSGDFDRRLAGLEAGAVATAGRLEALEAAGDLRPRVAAVEAKTAFQAAVTVGGYPALVFSGVNVHLVSGADRPNGLGNLVLGYNSQRSPIEANVRTGSHNLILGNEHNYSSEYGIASGFRHTLGASGAAAVGGERNSAIAMNAVVIGGSSNLARADASTVTGGRSNVADTIHGTVGGGAGRRNTLDGVAYLWAAGSFAQSY